MAYSILNTMKVLHKYATNGMLDESFSYHKFQITCNCNGIQWPREMVGYPTEPHGEKHYISAQNWWLTSSLGTIATQTSCTILSQPTSTNTAASSITTRSPNKQQQAFFNDLVRFQFLSPTYRNSSNIMRNFFPSKFFETKDAYYT